MAWGVVYTTSPPLYGEGSAAVAVGMVVFGSGPDCSCPCSLAFLLHSPVALAVQQKTPAPEPPCTSSSNAGDCRGVWCVPHSMRWPGGISRGVGGMVLAGCGSDCACPCLLACTCCTPLLSWPFNQKPPPRTCHAPPASVLGTVMQCGVFHIPCAGRNGQAAVLVGWSWQVAGQTAPGLLACLAFMLLCP
jgi:hypothetical protein